MITTVNCLQHVKKKKKRKATAAESDQKIPISGKKQKQNSDEIIIISQFTSISISLFVCWFERDYSLMDKNSAVTF